MIPMNPASEDNQYIVMDGKVRATNGLWYCIAGGGNRQDVGDLLSADVCNINNNSCKVCAPPAHQTATKEEQSPASLILSASALHKQQLIPTLESFSVTNSSCSQSASLDSSTRENSSRPDDCPPKDLESDTRQRSFAWYQAVAIFVAIFVPFLGIPACFFHRRAVSSSAAGKEQQTQHYLTASLALSTLGLLIAAAAIFTCFQLGIPNYPTPESPATPAPFDFNLFFEGSGFIDSMEQAPNDNLLSSLHDQKGHDRPNSDMEKIEKFFESFTNRNETSDSSDLVLAPSVIQHAFFLLEPKSPISSPEERISLGSTEDETAGNQFLNDMNSAYPNHDDDFPTASRLNESAYLLWTLLSSTE